MTYHEHVTLGLVCEIQSELREMRAEIKAIDATEDPRESGGDLCEGAREMLEEDRQRQREGKGEP